MSISKIQTLSMNPHFYSILVQGFLSGYQEPCNIELIFKAIPILQFSNTRKKLSFARSNSTIESLFYKDELLENTMKISGKINFVGYKERFLILESIVKKSIIILSSKEKIIINNANIIIIETIKHQDYDISIREWIKAAFYLGIIFRKGNEESINYLLGVD